MDLKLKKKPFEDFIKNTYKENKLTKNILAILHEQNSTKARRWPKQIKKLFHYDKSKHSIINGLIYYKN